MIKGKDLNEIKSKLQSLQSGGSFHPEDMTKDEKQKLIEKTAELLLKESGSKFNFTFKEASNVLGIGEEFLRRRVKKNIIASTYLGSKPMIHYMEIARILIEGVK